jgi:uncharacterized membrane protein YfcA
MPEAEFALIVFAGSLAAGMVGALTGLGGGGVIVPLLTFAFHMDFRCAAGASIISVISTSSAAASAYVKEGFTNLRVGMFLEIATTLGALGGALLAAHLRTQWLSALFGLVLLCLGPRRAARRRPMRSRRRSPTLSPAGSVCRAGSRGLTTARSVTACAASRSVSA